MSEEIKRAYWSRFLKRLNTTHQYRPVTVTVAPGKRADHRTAGTGPFFGLSLTRSGRRIGGVELFTGCWEPDRLNCPAFAVEELSRIFKTVADDGTVVGLTVEAADGAVLRVAFDGDPLPHQVVVEKVAYTLYERRGAHDGADIADWLTAERAVRDVTATLVG